MSSYLLGALLVVYAGLGPDDRDEWDAAMRSVRRIANLHGTIE